MIVDHPHQAALVNTRLHLHSVKIFLVNEVLTILMIEIVTGIATVTHAIEIGCLHQEKIQCQWMLILHLATLLRVVHRDPQDTFHHRLLLIWRVIVKENENEKGFVNVNEIEISEIGILVHILRLVMVVVFHLHLHRIQCHLRILMVIEIVDGILVLLLVFLRLQYILHLQGTGMAVMIEIKTATVIEIETETVRGIIGIEIEEYLMPLRHLLHPQLRVIHEKGNGYLLLQWMIGVIQEVPHLPILLHNGTVIVIGTEIEIKTEIGMAGLRFLLGQFQVII
jgi:hypothetical protein